jgi:hypothetical protein
LAGHLTCRYLALIYNQYISYFQEKVNTTVPEFIDPDFAKTCPKRSFSVTENERFGLVFAKTGSINSGTGQQKWRIGNEGILEHKCEVEEISVN